jgi:hypothetical protein
LGATVFVVALCVPAFCEGAFGAVTFWGPDPLAAPPFFTPSGAAFAGDSFRAAPSDTASSREVTKNPPLSPRSFRPFTYLLNYSRCKQPPPQPSTIRTADYFIDIMDHDTIRTA